MIADVWSSPCSISASTRFLKIVKASAMAALSTSMEQAQLASEPTARNSKRLPVKANGLVLLRSVLSINSSGISGMSNIIPCFPCKVNKSSLSATSIWFNNSVSCVPKNDEIMAGGASFAPNRCALVALMMDALSSPLCLYTLINVSTKNTTKRRLSSAVLPGACSNTPVSVHKLQLLCLPLPFTPANGFSCNSTRKPCLRATRFISDMSNML